MMQKPRKIGLNLDSTLTIGPVFMGVHFENWRDYYKLRGTIRSIKMAQKDFNETKLIDLNLLVIADVPIHKHQSPIRFIIPRYTTDIRSAIIGWL